jgi:hypothetical protein
VFFKAQENIFFVFLRSQFLPLLRCNFTLAAFFSDKILGAFIGAYPELVQATYIGCSSLSYRNLLTFLF